MIHLNNVIIQFDNKRRLSGYDRCSTAHIKATKALERNKLLTSVRHSAFENVLYTNELYYSE